MTDLLFTLYPWVKSLHIMAVLSWMAGLFYLPRLFVHHVEQAQSVEGASEIFTMMQGKLLYIIVRPAMIVAWVCGLIIVATPGIVDWNYFWPWTKGAGVIAMTGFHIWLAKRQKRFTSCGITVCRSRAQKRGRFTSARLVAPQLNLAKARPCNASVPPRTEQAMQCCTRFMVNR